MAINIDPHHAESYNNLGVKIFNFISYFYYNILTVY
jgi:hypothetical protein